MPTHVALLRGINVGGRSKVAMADLREIVTGLGHTDVATYIQSGNVVFTAKKRTRTTALATELERAIAKALDVRPRVAVLSRAELAKVIDANPYPDEPNPKVVHALFLTDEPPSDLPARLAEAEKRAAAKKGGRDAARLVGRVVYLHTPAGFGRSELAAQLGRGTKSVWTFGTARNWATVTKLLELCDG